MNIELSRPRPPPPREGAAARRGGGPASGARNGDRGARLLARRALGLLARAALRARDRPLDMRGLKQALVVAPHPDDDALGCGGTMALMSGGGRPPHVVFLTDG
jgi:hypothetical protein